VNYSTHKWKQPSFTRGAVLLLLAALTGCDRGQVREYQVAKEQVPPSKPAAALPPGHPDVSGGAVPSLQYKRPEGWQEAAPGEMRAASFRVAGKDGKEADVSVIPLPGLAGTDLANVNRWRSQVGLGPVSEAELATLAQPAEIAGQSAKLYEQAGTNSGSGDRSRILAAITRRDGTAWFFKMTGDDALVAEQKPTFIEFLKSVSFTTAGAQAPLPPSHPPIGSGSMMSAAAGAASSEQAKPNWEVPSDWKEIPGGQFLVAKFALTSGGNTQANVNVSTSAGDGGGVLANVNRWRAQLGLTPEAEADLSKEVQSVDLSGGKATLVDISGQDASKGQKARLVAVVVPHSGSTWFYKLMGDPQIVEREKEAFMKFVQTVKY
jgi:hypothetical protein